MVNGNLMKAKSIAEREHSVILLTCINLKTNFWSVLTGRLRQVLLFIFFYSSKVQHLAMKHEELQGKLHDKTVSPQGWVHVQKVSEVWEML